MSLRPSSPAASQGGFSVFEASVYFPHPHPPPPTLHTHLSVLLLRLAAAWTPGWDAEEGLPALSPPPPPLVGEGRWGGMRKAAIDDDERGGRCCKALVVMAWLPMQQHRRRAAAEACRCQGAADGVRGWRLPGMGIWTGEQKQRRAVTKANWNIANDMVQASLGDRRPKQGVEGRGSVASLEADEPGALRHHSVRLGPLGIT